MAVTHWEVTPWYIRLLFARPRYRRRMPVIGWQYYDENIHGRGLWV